MIAPLVHLNGTSARALVDDLHGALDAIRLAEAEHSSCALHPRDYVLHADAGAFLRARQAHFSRMDRLQSVRTELEVILEAVVAQEVRDAR